ncbi:MAG: hypothetical protein BGO55_14080 [Sphingobacteriales bacterium 50-39]|nr:PhzF family phenazine biosynthesis protein [Sphingobacteriales bacterium]OJW57599.1 MAG: hypothetical protein BGO55_14080 [Sphingobacteriales bacterium 50-39]
MSIPYYHVDVFSGKPLSGNGLTVFTEARRFTDRFMQRITQEMRQFESIFLQRLGDFEFKARVFTCEEELDFAGHPILGAAGVVHDIYFADRQICEWQFQLNKKAVWVHTKKEKDQYTSVMDQGMPEFGYVLSEQETLGLLPMMNLEMEDLYPGLMPCVVSTGLPYLILPLHANGIKAKIKVEDISSTLEKFGAKFTGTLEIPTLGIRTWDNAGKVEDIATGSLAGPCGALLVKYGFKKVNERFLLNQGANIGRPSELYITIKATETSFWDVWVGGGVCKVGHGFLEPDLIMPYGD